jgi:methionyl aminopeptidase
MARSSGKIPLLTPAEYPRARAAARKVVETHQRLSAWLREGATLAQVDAFVARTLEDLACRSCFLHYKPSRMPAFPSHACLSVNDCVVHGTPGSLTRPMREGDLLKIDIGVWFEGWIGDAGWTYAFGEPSPTHRRLMACGKESLRRGIAALKAGEPLVNWARAVQRHVEIECGFHLVRGLGGHGIGRELHTEPYVSNVVPESAAEWPQATLLAQPGLLLALEPMIAVGTGKTRQDPAPRHWPIYSADGSATVHYEHDVLMTPEGPEILTQGLMEVADVIV